MINYTKYGKHRYQIYILNDDGKVEKIIYEDVGNRNVTYKMRILGNQYYKNYSSRNYDFITIKYRMNMDGYIMFDKHSVWRTYDRDMYIMRFVFIDMLQLDKIPKDILNLIEFDYHNRELALNSLFEIL